MSAEDDRETSCACCTLLRFPHIRSITLSFSRASRLTARWLPDPLCRGVRPLCAGLSLKPDAASSCDILQNVLAGNPAWTADLEGVNVSALLQVHTKHSMHLGWCQTGQHQCSSARLKLCFPWVMCRTFRAITRSAHARQTIRSLPHVQKCTFWVLVYANPSTGMWTITSTASPEPQPPLTGDRRGQPAARPRR